MKIKMQILVAGLLLHLVSLQLLRAQAPPPFDTLKICALRVQFQPDNNPLTTGNGLFMVDSITTDPNAIDPAPHNKQYFEDQLTAAANYFWEVSKGRLKIEGDVFPAGENEAFQLPKKMGDYNPNTTDEEINRGISQLFVDAVKAADASAEQIDFSKYDLVVVFHAGVGKDIELGYDPTPQDIPSLFLSKSFLKKALGNDFDGIPVNQGQFKISSGILLPETQNQEGYQIALTGFLVSNIGSYLGLYDLFSPSTQKSGIGRFGLMDAGLLNANGLIPAPPCAFSRILLGWETPVDLVTPADNLELARLFSEKASQLPTVYRVWLNEDEYYLIECRGDPQVNLDSLYDVLAYNRDELPSYKELLTTHFADRIEVGASGVVTRVENYDWGLPGSGILIWHIDERVIREKGAENKINDDPNWRGVDLEEADGAQDIGQTYGLLDAGYGKSLGWFADFWFKDRPEFMKGFELYKNEFSSTSRPSTVSNWNHAYSHIKLFDFSANQGPVMHFSFTQEMSETGFPTSLINDADRLTSFLPIRRSFESWLYLGTEQGSLWVLIDNDTTQTLNLYPDFQKTGHGAVRYLNAMDVDHNGQYDHLVVTFNDRLLIQPIVFPISGIPIYQLRWQAPAQILSQPVVLGDELLVNCANDSLYRLQVQMISLNLVEQKAGFGQYGDLVFYENFALPPQNNFGHAAIGINADRTAQAVFATVKDGETEFTIYHIGAGKHSKFVFDGVLTSDFALADLDGNGVVDIVFNTTNEIYALNLNGTLVSDFPISINLTHSDQLIGTPLIADLDGDGQAEIVVGSQQGGILALKKSGLVMSNFPLSVGGTMSFSPALVQWDGDQPLELLAVNDQGTVNVWQLNFDAQQKVIWPMAQLNLMGNPVFRLAENESAVKITDLLPAERVYNYPNPNQGDNTTIRFYLSEDAEVRIRIFDLAGQRVMGIDMPGKGRTDNEFELNVKDFPSGIYLCQVEAKAQKTGKVERRLFKMMVVH